MELGVAVGMDSVMLVRSGCGGISTCISVGFEGASEGGSDDDHGGAGGGRGGSDGSWEGSGGAGASGISSTLGSVESEVFTSASSISTSLVGGGVGSFAGVGSRVPMIIVGSADMSMAEESSSGGDGGRGEGLFEDTSLRAGDLASIFTDEDRMRSRMSLSS